MYFCTVFSWKRCCLIVGYLWFAANCITAKIFPYPYSTEFKQSVSIQGYELLLSLNGYWNTAEGLAYPVPFISDQHSMLELSYMISLPANIPDTIFFYTQGLGPSFSIYLDDKLLYYSLHSRKNLWLPIPRRLLKNASTLKIMLQRESYLASTATRSWFGLYHPLYLLRRNCDTIPSLHADSYLPVRAVQDSIIIFSTLNSSYGFHPDSLWFRNQLLHLRQAGYRSVFFTEPLDEFLWPIITESEIYVILNIPKTAKVAYYFQYQDSSRSWLNSKEQKTIYWGKFFDQIHQKQEVIAPTYDSQISLFQRSKYVIQLLIVLLILTALRIYSAKLFSTLHSFWLTPKELYSQLLDTQKLRNNGIVFFGLAKIPLVAIGLGLIQEQLSMRFGLLMWHYSTAILWFVLLLGYAIYYGSKFSTIFFMAHIYRKRYLSQMGTGLDLAAGFFTWELMLLVALASYIVAEKVQNLLVLVWLGLLIFHIFRRLYLINSILGNYFQLGYLARMLYLCGFEILPWLLLFSIR